MKTLFIMISISYNNPQIRNKLKGTQKATKSKQNVPNQYANELFPEHFIRCLILVSLSFTGKKIKIDELKAQASTSKKAN